MSESLEDWIVREARAISGPRTHLQDSEALIQFGLSVARRAALHGSEAGPQPCQHCGHLPHPLITQSVVTNQPGHPVSAVCVLTHCQHMGEAGPQEAREIDDVLKRFDQKLDELETALTPPRGSEAGVSARVLEALARQAYTEGFIAAREDATGQKTSQDLVDYFWATSTSRRAALGVSPATK